MLSCPWVVGVDFSECQLLCRAGKVAVAARPVWELSAALTSVAGSDAVYSSDNIRADDPGFGDYAFRHLTDYAWKYVEEDLQKMNIPGFTAEASLEQTGNRYIVAMQSTEAKNSEAIIPQARVLDGFCIGNGSYCCFRGPDGKWTCGRTIST